MNDMLEGLMTINGDDIYTLYGAFLAETREDRTENFDALLLPPPLKAQPAVALQDEIGERLPEELTQVFEARDVTLQFAIEAPSGEEFLRRYLAFIRFLADGKAGWLQLRIKDLEQTLEVYLLSFTEYSQIVPFGTGKVAATFKVKFREPKPFFGKDRT